MVNGVKFNENIYEEILLNKELYKSSFIIFSKY
jgi:hypothetical protein